MDQGATTRPRSRYASNSNALINRQEIFMPQSEAFQTFSSGCKRLLFSITNRQLTEKEARILQYYCKDILAKIAPSLPKPPATKHSLIDSSI
jgi:hypothetical protein